MKNVGGFLSVSDLLVWTGFLWHRGVGGTQSPLPVSGPSLLFSGCPFRPAENKDTVTVGSYSPLEYTSAGS